MRRPFILPSRLPHVTHPVAAATQRALHMASPVARQARRVGQTLNPVAGLPSPFPQRRPATVPRDFAVGEYATPAQEGALRRLWWDGFFAESSEIVWLQFFSVYALALGASAGLIGVLASLTYLVAAVSMWPGAVWAERTRRYKFISLLANGALSRVGLLALALIPGLATGEAALLLVAVVGGLRSFFVSVAIPAWNAFTGDVVPPRLRARFFASRNFARELASLITAPVVGLLIYSVGGMGGWQLAWFLAFVLGTVATSFFAGIPYEEAAHVRHAIPPGRRGARRALRDSRLLWFVGTSGAFQFSVMLAGPFLAVYLVDALGGSALWVGLAVAAVPLGGIAGQIFGGRLSERYGPKRLLVVTGLAMPLVPWLWILASSPWQVLFINVFAGFLWAGTMLGTFNLVLSIAPAERRPTYSALQQAGFYLASFGGAIAGGLLIDALGYHLVFFLSGAGRGLATLALWRKVDDTEAEEESGEPATPVEERVSA